MVERTPYDGRPYYCAMCGLGIGEFMACEEPDCRLESPAKAEHRAHLHKLSANNTDARKR